MSAEPKVIVSLDPQSEELVQGNPPHNRAGAEPASHLVVVAAGEREPMHVQRAFDPTERSERACKGFPELRGYNGAHREPYFGNSDECVIEHCVMLQRKAGSEEGL